MRLFRHPEDIPPELKGGVVALGSFDGLHRGHQVVVGRAAQKAHDLGAPLWVLTTEPHPRSFFRPNDPPFRLTSLRTKAHLLATFGVENMLVLPFDARLAGVLAQDFVMDILIGGPNGGLGVRHAVAGYDYRFGKARGGGVGVLGFMGEMEGFGVTVVAPVTDDQNGPIVFSSSAIREALARGDVRTATEALGHWWIIDGHVLGGDKRGRTIGFPTANLDLGEYLKPAFGVYAVRVEVADGPQAGVYDAVANIGCRPTFAKDNVTLEAHLFDFTGDLYDRIISVEVVDFIRPERKFDGLEALKAQIAADCGAARTILADPALARDRYALPRFQPARKPA